MISVKFDVLYTRQQFTIYLTHKLFFFLTLKAVHINKIKFTEEVYEYNISETITYSYSGLSLKL